MCAFQRACHLFLLGVLILAALRFYKSSAQLISVLYDAPVLGLLLRCVFLRTSVRGFVYCICFSTCRHEAGTARLLFQHATKNSNPQL
jgi:hypothetical protein